MSEQAFEGCEPRNQATVTGEYLIQHPRSFDTCLRDGRWVRIRPITAGDKNAMVAAMDRMSPKSRYFRFHAALPRLSEDSLRYLTEVDQRDHVAWAVFSLDEPGRPGVATVRFVRDARNPAEAEIAITIIDEYQGVGLGRILIDTILLSAHEHAVEQLVGYVSPENERAISLLESAGARSGEVEAGLLRMDLPVITDGRRYRHSGAIRRPGPEDALLQ